MLLYYATFYNAIALFKSYHYCKLYSSWYPMRHVILGISYSFWYYYSLAFHSANDIESIEPTLTSFFWKHFIDEDPFDLTIPSAIKDTVYLDRHYTPVLYDEQDWGDFEPMYNHYIRRMTAEICRSKPFYEIVYWRYVIPPEPYYDMYTNIHTDDITTEILQDPIWWVSSYDFLDGVILNVVEKRQLEEWHELEHITWTDLSWDTLVTFTNQQIENNLTRFEDCVWNDVELWSEEMRDIKGMNLFRFHWHISARGKYFLP